MDKVVMYVDGACKGNPGPGGWGALLQFHGTKGLIEKELFGGLANTTNNQMELTAAIEALRALKRPCDVSLYTDSKYVIQGMTEWLPWWKSKDWRTANKQPVKNVELWKALEEAAASHQVSWTWVKGHAGHPGNERADELANQGAFSF